MTQTTAENTPVLVVGATGDLGRRIVDALLDRPEQPSVRATRARGQRR